MIQRLLPLRPIHATELLFAAPDGEVREVFDGPVLLPRGQCWRLDEIDRRILLLAPPAFEPQALVQLTG